MRAALDRGSVSWSEAQRAQLVERPGSLEEVKKALVGPVRTGFFFTITGAADRRFCGDFASILRRFCVDFASSLHRVCTGFLRRAAPSEASARLEGEAGFSLEPPGLRRAGAKAVGKSTIVEWACADIRKVCPCAHSGEARSAHSDEV